MGYKEDVFRESVRELLKNQKQKDLANKLGVSSGSVSRWSRGSRPSSTNMRIQGPKMTQMLRAQVISHSRKRDGKPFSLTEAILGCLAATALGVIIAIIKIYIWG